MKRSIFFQRRPMFAVALIVLLAGGACTPPPPAQIETVTGSGNVITETRDVSGFSRIEMLSSGEIVVRVGDVETLTISGEDNLLPPRVAQVTQRD